MRTVGSFGLATVVFAGISSVGKGGDTKLIEVRGKDWHANAQELSLARVDVGGEIRLGVSATVSPVGNEGLAWCGARLGNSLFIGTSSGRIYRKDPEAEAVMEFETGELLVTTLLVEGKEIYAGTIPNGKVFRRDDRGTWREYQKLESPYVWALASLRGEIYAGCGQPASLVRLTGDGAPCVVYRAKAEHILCLLDEGTRFVLGTAGPGRLIRTDPEELLEDFGNGEVSAIQPAGSDLWLAVNYTRAAPAELIKGAMEAKGGIPTGTTEPRPAICGTVWRVSKGRTTELARFPNSWISGLRPEETAVLVSQSTTARIYRIHRSGESDLWLDVKANQGTGFARGSDALLLGNPAGIAPLERKVGPGRYLSKTIDCGFVSRFGRVDIEAEGKVTCRIRTGRSDRIDVGWSDWSTPMESFPSELKVPKGRFLQFEITLHEPSSVAKSFRIWYRNENQAPVIRDIKITPQPPNPVSPAAIPGIDPSLRATPLRSLLWLVEWQAFDPDGDELLYEISYRRADGDLWVPIGGAGKQFGSSAIRWNIDSIPDGRYVLRLRVSDERGNLPSETLTAEREHGPFVIDNGKPQVVIADSAGGRIRGTARDSTSRIARLEYRIDGGDWRGFQPKDGLLDSESEEFEFRIEPRKLDPGIRLITIQAVDEKENVGLASVTIRGGD